MKYLFKKLTRTRSNGHKYEKFRFRKEIAENWFTNRALDEWHKLGRYVVEADTIASFKRRLDVFMDKRRIW